MEWFYWIFAITLGALIGSFLNVVIYRGPSLWGLLEEREPGRGSLAHPRSYCPSCRRPIPIRRLVPIVSYFMQRGRCAECKARIPLRYPLVELAGVAVAAVSYGFFGLSVTALLAAVFGWTLLALAVIDGETGYLPDWLTLPLVILGLIANLNGRFVPPLEAGIGAAAGYLAFRLVGAAFYRLRSYEGLGQGDAKLLAAIGAWGGWTILPGVVLVGSLVTLIGVAIAHLSAGSVHAKTEIPFGPGLCAAGFALLIAAAKNWPPI